MKTEFHKCLIVCFNIVNEIKQTRLLPAAVQRTDGGHRCGLYRLYTR